MLTLLWLLFGQLLETFGLLFTPMSGHTAQHVPMFYAIEEDDDDTRKTI